MRIYIWLLYDTSSLIWLALLKIAVRKVRSLETNGKDTPRFLPNGIWLPPERVNLGPYARYMKSNIVNNHVNHMFNYKYAQCTTDWWFEWTFHMPVFSSSHNCLSGVMNDLSFHLLSKPFRLWYPWWNESLIEFVLIHVDIEDECASLTKTWNGGQCRRSACGTYFLPTEIS